MSTKRTPGTWKRQAKTGPNRWRIVDAEGHQVADVNHYNIDAEGNAEFVVRACNAHDDLMFSLALILSYMPTPESDIDPARAHSVRAAYASLAAGSAA
jgi:uncharacterized protein YcgI (DUF1989 family)